MGLYLAVFDGDIELDGIEVGPYAEFDSFRVAVGEHVENGVPGSRCPVLMSHSDCDGIWTPSESRALRLELKLIAEKFASLPPASLPDSSMRAEVAAASGLVPRNLLECFFDVDGVPVVERMLHLVDLSVSRSLPIYFQ